jgi:hypothetical protein
LERDYARPLIVALGHRLVEDVPGISTIIQTLSIDLVIGALYIKGRKKKIRTICFEVKSKEGTYDVIIR